jgi:hypothetical protein
MAVVRRIRITGHECAWGIVWGSAGGKAERRRPWGLTRMDVHYKYRTHRTPFDKGGRGRGEWKHSGEGEHVLRFVPKHLQNYHMKSPHAINSCLFKIKWSLRKDYFDSLGYILVPYNFRITFSILWRIPLVFKWQSYWIWRSHWYRHFNVDFPSFWTWGIFTLLYYIF